MSHDLRLALTGGVPIDSFIEQVQAHFEELLGGSAPRVTLLEGEMQGKWSAPVNRTIGDRGALYVLGIEGVGELLRLGTYPDLEDMAEGMDAAAVDADVQVPFGQTELNFVLAASAAAALAMLNGTRIVDHSGLWVGGDGSALSPQEFMVRYKKGKPLSYWMAAARIAGKP